MLVTIVAGARPNFVKIAPIIKAIKEFQLKGVEIDYRLIHTGQHYDKRMSGDFFTSLGIPTPNVNLSAGGGSQAQQTASIMVKFERELLLNKPEVVLVVGDVTSTMACAITAKKLCIPVVHVEAGIRSGDLSMPEEINRILTDSICDHFFTTSETANQQLLSSGVGSDRIHFVGNTMIDCLIQNMDRLSKPIFWDDFNLSPKNYYILTLHRPGNVDNPVQLKVMLDTILQSIGSCPVIFPVHPRTRVKLDEMNYSDPRIIQVEPLGYLEFIFLVKNARAIVTDSGGITEESTVLGVPCLTLRNTTERPETVTMGTNELVGTDPRNLLPFLQRIENGVWKVGTIPPFWDGKTSERIIRKLVQIYSMPVELEEKVVA